MESDSGANLARPFEGVVLCCTSVPVDYRTDIADKVTELGGVYAYNLTSDVTHLVVGDYNTPKYRHVAAERPDVRPMCAGWVGAVLEPWIRDEPMDLEALERTWQLRPLEAHGGLPAGSHGEAIERGRLLCSVTGFEEDDRQRVIDMIVDNGGIYSGDLTRSVTHLIVNRPEGQKYAAAIRWGVRAVSVEWLRDSVRRGMILDEQKYDPQLPLAERGIGAWQRYANYQQPSILGKRAREAASGSGAAAGAGAAAAAAAEQQGRRKLRKTTSMKLAVQADTLWGDLLGKGAASSAPLKTPAVATAAATAAMAEAAASTASRAPKETLWPAEPTPAPAAAVSTRGVLAAAVFCIQGFSPSRTEVLVNAVATMGGTVVLSVDEMETTAASMRQDPGLVGLAPPLLAAGRTGAVAEVAAAAAAATTATTKGALIYQHVIVPQETRPEALPAVPDGVFLVTEFFIEKCLHKRKYLLPTSDDAIIGCPFAVFPIAGFDSLSICTSGFTGVDLNQIDKTVRQVGARYQERFTAQCSLLLTAGLQTMRKQKLELALAWRVPVVDVRWLLNCLRMGKLLPMESYLFPQLRQSPSLSLGLTLGLWAGDRRRKSAAAAAAETASSSASSRTVPTLVLKGPAPRSVQSRSLPPAAAVPAVPLPTTAADDGDMFVDAFETAPTHPQTAEVVVAAPPPPPEAVAAPPRADVPARSLSPEKQPPPPPPPPFPTERKPLDRVVSEIADSAAGDDDDDDPFEREDDGAAENEGAEAKVERDPRLQLRSSATTATTTGKPSCRRPALGRAASANAASLMQGVQPALPLPLPPPRLARAPSSFGISIGDLMKDSGGDGGSGSGSGSGGWGRLGRSGSSSHGRVDEKAAAPPQPDGAAASTDRPSAVTATTAAAAPSSSLTPTPPPPPPLELQLTQAHVEYLDPEAERYRAQLMDKIMGGASKKEARDGDGGGSGGGVMVDKGIIAGQVEDSGRWVRRSSRRR